MQRYSVVLIPAEEGGFTVLVPVLPGCNSEGDTFEEAMANAREALTLYLQVLGDRGEELPTESGAALVVPIEVEAPAPVQPVR
ncbi:MAG: type II toxin-antitoxin system HicB family antitoxin [Dehalococcoidia bacterium]